MSGAVRWRLLELTRQIDGIRRGIDLLEQKREALLREIVQRGDLRLKERQRFDAAYARARQNLVRALVDVGGPSAAAAGLAQPANVALSYRQRSLMGVLLPRFASTFQPFRVHYGPAGTAATVDTAATSFAALLPLVIELAEEESAARNLRRALIKATRTVNALKTAVLPRLEEERRAITAALEEEERDEMIRRRAWPRASASNHSVRS
jgi:V/A-type H+-transporting ATPase subunit D